MINHSIREISILLCTPNWLNIPKVKEILTLVNKKANEGVLIRILFHTSVLVNDGKLPNSIFTNRNIHLRGFEKKLTTDAMIMLLDSNKAVVLDTKNDSTTDNKKYFATYTNGEEFLYTYLSSFEKIWLLEKVIKCDIA